MNETNSVSPLRQRMIEDMAARKLNPHTQRSHVYSCKRFAAWLKRSPDTATPDEVRRFQLYLIECHSAWGPDADRHAKLLIHFISEGLHFRAYSQSSSHEHRSSCSRRVFDRLDMLHGLGQPDGFGLVGSDLAAKVGVQPDEASDDRMVRVGFESVGHASTMFGLSAIAPFN